VLENQESSDIRAPLKVSKRMPRASARESAYRIHATGKAWRDLLEFQNFVLFSMKTGTHSPWLSRLLAERGHEVIVAQHKKWT